MTAGLLEGIRVLDLSQMLAGPLCAMRLADLGAEVIKVEPPAGEWARTHTLANAWIEGVAAGFLGLNRNKKSVVIDLKQEPDRAAFYDLVRNSDVILQNFRVGTAARLGLDYPTLHEVNPRIVYCSISAFGDSGPYRDRPGQDLVIQGYSGSMYSVGGEDDPPTPGGLWAVDTATGYQAAIAILAAIVGRERTGIGDHVQLNMLEVALDMQIQELTVFLNLGKQPERTKARLAHAWVPAPYGVYPTSDGHVIISMGALSTLGEVLDDDRLREMDDWAYGMTHRDEIHEIVSGITPRRTTQEWIDLLDSHALWSGPVYRYEDLDRDPHIAETGVFVTIEHPTIGSLRTVRSPIRSERSENPLTPPPDLGEHTEEVLRRVAGYDDTRIAAFFESAGR